MKKTTRTDQIYFEAMIARDRRFDGKFFVGVKTTGIYCRPICPAKPKFENVEFFHHALAAEKAGYRPCMRCRPEAAPDSPAWQGTSAIVQRALKALSLQVEFKLNEEEFASKFGVSARHLRRLFKEELGRSPAQVFFDNRLNLARKLIVETNIPIIDVAFASGFGSVRRFNDSFLKRFKTNPRSLRNKKIESSTSGPLKLSLNYRPPYDFQGLLDSYSMHRIGDLEWVENKAYHRKLFIKNKSALIIVSDDSQSCCIRVEFRDVPLEFVAVTLQRVRTMFDVDSDPILISNHFEKDKRLRSLLKQQPGLRIPSGWDPFEVAVMTILGQLVSIEQGRKLVASLIQIVLGDKAVCFPTPEQIIGADLSALKTTERRKQTLKDLCLAITQKTLSLESTQDVNDFVKRLMGIKGIGPWTASYMALKVLRDADAFPESDLILAKQVKKYPEIDLEKVRPWRGYAAVLLWSDYVSKTKSSK